MNYFYTFQNWLYQTSLYQNILEEMPAPLNNIYFDSCLLIALVGYLIYQIIDAIRIACYHRRIRRIHKTERQMQSAREQEMLYWEQQVNEKEERLGRFLDYMENLFASRMRKPEDTERYNLKKGSKKIGRRNFFWRRKTRWEENKMKLLSSHQIMMWSWKLLPMMWNRSRRSAKDRNWKKRSCIPD